MPDPTNLEERIIDVFHEVARATGQTLPPLDGGTRIAAIGLGSMILLEVIGTVETRMSIRFPNERLGAIVTISDFVKLTEELVAARHPA